MNFPMPIIRGVIARRLLINFRVDPEVVARLLPLPFRPRLVRGRALAGVCLIRLEQLRPRGVAGVFGIASENAAHRIAVEWDGETGPCQGVFIPRRDTNSLLNQLAGGRLFPGVHHLADFRIFECPTRIKLDLRSRDGITRLRVAARIAGELSEHSVFASLEEASAFFQDGALGWSPSVRENEFDGLELRTFEWHMQPLAVERIESSYFADARRFPNGSVEFDSALLMRGLEHEWIARGKMRAGESALCAT
ncbi:MAG: DUF2071 domain-containing protein [Verrucomicrobiota bacterium]